MGEWRYSYIILDLVTRWRWMLSFTPWPLYPQGRVTGTHCLEVVWVWKQRTREKSLAPTGNRNPAVQPVVRRYTDWAIAALILYDESRESYNCSYRNLYELLTCLAPHTPYYHSSFKFYRVFRKNCVKIQGHFHLNIRQEIERWCPQVQIFGYSMYRYICTAVHAWGSW
jgi:hypothetical protein